MNYKVKHTNDNCEVLFLYTFDKSENGIYYGLAELEYNNNMKFKLAEIPIANGIIRIDRIVYNSKDTLAKKNMFRGYSLPQLKPPIVNIIKKTRKKQ